VCDRRKGEERREMEDEVLLGSVLEEEKRMRNRESRPRGG
jgi:hypothetical protein